MKADYHLLPWGGVESVAILMTLMGQWKYKEPKWKTIGTTEHVNAAIRHIRGWLAEEEDEESGMSHLVHAATRLLMAVEREMGEWETDEGNNREDGDGGDGTPPLMAGGFMTEDDDGDDDDDEDGGGDDVLRSIFKGIFETWDGKSFAHWEDCIDAKGCPPSSTRTL